MPLNILLSVSLCCFMLKSISSKKVLINALLEISKLVGINFSSSSILPLECMFFIFPIGISSSFGVLSPNKPNFKRKLPNTIFISSCVYCGSCIDVLESWLMLSCILEEMVVLTAMYLECKKVFCNEISATESVLVGIFIVIIKEFVLCPISKTSGNKSWFGASNTLPS